ncbi:hypothetical protein MUCCIDRAFT_82360 [Mucor lusitanicus CBS 277.49]|uniref:Uncharacterized protein n=1 Tax=Mucor lusitanicus CBS 277.49 TaxID=747725 RepID=A0A162QH35_MUCCL|nr:hypothetical protein MUCCIDRAFT_82360 [Mucor lusitanicus CBS 277.49]
MTVMVKRDSGNWTSEPGKLMLYSLVKKACLSSTSPDQLRGFVVALTKCSYIAEVERSCLIYFALETECDPYAEAYNTHFREGILNKIRKSSNPNPNYLIVFPTKFSIGTCIQAGDSGVKHKYAVCSFE